MSNNASDAAEAFAPWRFIPAADFGAHLAALPPVRVHAEEWRTPQAKARLPHRNPNYVFPEAAFRRFALWWHRGGCAPLYLSGPTGAGKTSLVRQWCSCTGTPLVCVTARPRMDRRELLGRWIVKPSGGMQWIDGPAALAWRYGWLLLVNEFSAAPAEMWVSANDLLEGLPLEVDQTGEVIPRHPRARIVVTDNTRGCESEAPSGYLGRHAQDRSVLDRFWHMRLEGPDEAEEAAALVRCLPPDLQRLPPALLQEAARIAAGAAHESRLAPTAAPLGLRSAPMALSRRTTQRFFELLLCWMTGEAEIGDADPVAWAADAAAAESFGRPARAALLTLLQAHWGDKPRELKAALEAWRQSLPNVECRARPQDSGMLFEKKISGPKAKRPLERAAARADDDSWPCMEEASLFS